MKISAIIPTFNRDKLLERTLLSIYNQKTNIEFEVIVIDNGSTDMTKNICEKYSTKIQNLVYHYDSTPGLLTGRHKGIKISRGEILCFLDDDVDLNDKYINNLQELFDKNREVKLATGPCLPEYEITPPFWLNYFWERVPEGRFCHWLSLLEFGNNEKLIDPNYVWGLNFCIRKQTVLELHGFHPDSLPTALQQYQGDGETGLTIKAAKRKDLALYHPGLSLKHYVSRERLTTEYFKKRAFFEGVSKSFTALRVQFLKSNKSSPSIVENFKAMIWPLYFTLLNFRKIWTKKGEPSEIKEMKSLFNKSESDGYAFHQKSFIKNEKVRKWVLRDDYWDYHISDK